jgi:hypothetical protein
MMAWGTSKNKYGATRATYNGQNYDSMYEAQVAQELDLRQKGGDIKAWDSQYVVEIVGHLPDGTPAYKRRHRVDFRIHHNDGSYELLEAKGVETRDWQMVRKLLEMLWLPLHPDHKYTVVKKSKQFNSKGGW